MDNRRKRLLYLSQHRGMKETDLLMGQFASNNLLSMNDQELDQFEQLLQEADNDLLKWILEQEDVPHDINGSVMGNIINFKKSL